MDARATAKTECFLFAQVQIKNYPKRESQIRINSNELLGE